MPPANKQTDSGARPTMVALIPLVSVIMMQSCLITCSSSPEVELDKISRPSQGSSRNVQPYGKFLADNESQQSTMYIQQQSRSQHQAIKRSPPEEDSREVARLLVERFHFVLSPEELTRFEQQDSISVQRPAPMLEHHLPSVAGANSSAEALHAFDAQSTLDQRQSNLETRTLSLIQSNLSKLTSINLNELSQQQQKRNFIRVMNRVFSRVELPEAFNANKATTRTVASQQQTSISGGGGGGIVQSVGSASLAASLAVAAGSGSGASQAGLSQYCASHLGCISEIPNMPVMFKLKTNVSAAFTIYTRARGWKNGLRILYEPLMHYQLRDGAEQTMSELALQKEVMNITRSLKLAATLQSGTSGNGNNHKRRNTVLPGASAAQLARKQQASKLLATVATSWISANKIAQSRELPFDLAALEQSGFNSSLNTRIIIGGYFAKEDEEWIEELVRQWLLLEDNNVIKVSWQDSNRGLYHSAAHNSRIVGRQLSLFLHYLDEMFQIDLNKFHLVGHSLGAHIAGFVGADNEGQIARITGLDPAGPIFVELSALHRLDASDAKFVDVLHTNGGTITKGALGLSSPSGHVDYYCNGGSLQPGCLFSSVTMSIIMDPVERIACNHRRSYRYFTEIIKLAISERRKLARNERRMRANEPGEMQHDTDERRLFNRSHTAALSSRFPHAFLFETNKLEDLVRLVQPQLKLSQLGLLTAGGGSGDGSGGTSSTEERRWALTGRAGVEPGRADHQLPLRRQIEFHQMDPEFPRDKRGLYFFRTRQEAPFFASKQYSLRLALDEPLKRKVTLLVRINSTLVAEVELDELERTHSLVFVLNNPEAIDHSAIFSGRSSRAPDLWLMWRQRSFNLLLGSSSANEIHLNALELSLLDENEEPTRGERVGSAPSSSSASSPSSVRLERQRLGLNDYLVRYEPNLVGQERQLLDGATVTTTTAATTMSVATRTAGANPTRAHPDQQAGGGQSFVITRNQWHKFDGRPVAINK